MGEPYTYLMLQETRLLTINVTAGRSAGLMPTAVDVTHQSAMERVQVENKPPLPRLTQPRRTMPKWYKLSPYTRKYTMAGNAYTATYGSQQSLQTLEFIMDGWYKQENDHMNDRICELEAELRMAKRKLEDAQRQANEVQVSNQRLRLAWSSTEEQRVFWQQTCLEMCARFPDVNREMSERVDALGAETAEEVVGSESETESEWDREDI